MYRELTNLLPKDRSRAFRREYFTHLGVVIVIALTLVVVVHGLLLFPTYLSLSAELSAQQRELDTVNSHLQEAGQKDIGTRITALTTDASYLSKLGSVPTSSAVIRTLLLVPHGGITLTGISFTPPANDSAPGHVLLTGNASTREALRAYDASLAALPFVTSAELPISAYAKETDIPFLITVTGSLHV